MDETINQDVQRLMRDNGTKEIAIEAAEHILVSLKKYNFEQATVDYWEKVKLKVEKL